MPHPDKNNEIETIGEHDSRDMLKKREKLPRNDSVLQQMSYESSLLKEAMFSFTEMNEDDEESDSENEAVGTPSSSVSSVLETVSEEKIKKNRPVQFSLSCDKDNMDVSPKDTEPLLGATGFSEPEPLNRKDVHHVSLEEIKQIITEEEMEGQSSLTNIPTTSADKFGSSMTNMVQLPKPSSFSTDRKDSTRRSTDSVGFSPVMDSNKLDTMEVVNETALSHLCRQQSIEESIHEFVMESSRQKSVQTIASSPSRDNIQMITIEKKQEKGPEAFV